MKKRRTKSENEITIEEERLPEIKWCSLVLDTLTTRGSLVQNLRTSTIGKEKP